MQNMQNILHILGRHVSCPVDKTLGARSLMSDRERSYIILHLLSLFHTLVVGVCARSAFPGKRDPS